jgi:hypothetical protein
LVLEVDVNVIDAYFTANIALGETNALKVDNFVQAKHRLKVMFS